MVTLYDTTLRDGTQAEDFNLSMEDKVRIALKLDDLGIHFVEGGWPGSNPRDRAFFEEMRNYRFKNARLAAFGSTHHPRKTPETDENLQAILGARTEVVTLFGKTWTIHVKDALNTTLERNLDLVRGSLAYVRPHVPTLFYDAEHFFDGFAADRDYAIATLRAAVEGGAELLVLCDTNGGNIPSTITAVMETVKAALPGVALGIHAHNDADLAVANSLAGVQAGAVQVQGTINGVGERCGNANLVSVIANLCLKLGVQCLPPEQLKKLKAVASYVMELANVPPSRFQPYVGLSAFAHKGGVHISAVERNPHTYEHVSPELVGNKRRILMSDLSGRAAIRRKAEEYGISLSSSDPVALQVLEEVKELEHAGYQFEAAEASLELLVNRAMGINRRYFELEGFRVVDQKNCEDEAPVCEATIRVRVGGQVEHTAALGAGPVNALDNALRKALEKFYPQLRDVNLSDYKVRVLPGVAGTSSRVRVLIESSDGTNQWGTVGVSHDILEASWQALVDSITYKLYKDEKQGHPC